MAAELVKGKVAVVMASTRGIGWACAESLMDAGFDILICGRDEETVREAALQLNENGASADNQADGVACDVTRDGEIRALFEYADARFGRLDVLVLNAGGPQPGAALELSDSAWEDAYELTLMSAVRSVRCAVPRMMASGYGRIIAIGSSSVRSPIPRLALSNVFRAGVNAFMKTLAHEVAPNGITANVVCPGRVGTDRVRKLDEVTAEREAMTVAAVEARSQATIPMGRYGTPSDVAALVSFLASPAAGFITGQTVLVDGGMVCSIP